MSESLRLFTKNERMSKSLIFLANRSFAHLWAKNERFAQKPMSGFPALIYPIRFALGLNKGTTTGLTFYPSQKKCIAYLLYDIVKAYQKDFSHCEVTVYARKVNNVIWKTIQSVCKNLCSRYCRFKMQNRQHFVFFMK